MKRHIEAVHKDKRDHLCEEYGDATSNKSSLTNHMASIHKMGTEKFNIEQGTYVGRNTLKEYTRRKRAMSVKSVVMLLQQSAT